MIDTKPIVELNVSVPLRVTDFDCYKRLKPSAMLELFQEAATQQAEIMGIGRAGMAKHGVFWVVIRTYLEVYGQPPLYSTVNVRTWPHSPSRFSFLRDYTISSPEGEVYVKGTSEWVLMSIEDRSFVQLEHVYEPPDNLVEDRNFQKKARKLPDFTPQDDTPFLIVPSYSSVDVNGHVNNSYYADYPFDAINPGEQHSVSKFQIDYRHEVCAGKALLIYNQVEDGALLTKGVDDEGTIMFAARTEFDG